MTRRIYPNPLKTLAHASPTYPTLTQKSSAPTAEIKQDNARIVLEEILFSNTKPLMIEPSINPAYT